MRKIILSLMIFLPLFAVAQEGAWTLDRCIQYALDHNLSVKQGDLNVQQQQVNLSTARNAVWPAVSANATQSMSFGRGLSEDNTYVSSNTANTSFGLGASVDLFTGLHIRLIGFYICRVAQEEIDASPACISIDQLLEQFR